MYSKSLTKIVVWKKPDNTYYYRIHKKILNPYDIGFHNSYGHEVVFIIDDLQERKFRRHHKFLSQSKKNKIIDFINWI